MATFRPDTWTEDDPYGYRAALCHVGKWRQISDNLADFHGALEKDVNSEFHMQWHFVVCEKI